MKVNRSEIEEIYNSIKKDRVSGTENEACAAKSKIAGERKDSLVISDKAKSHSGVGGVVSRMVNDIDKPTSSEKLLRLKKAIAEGTYNVPARDIAEKMLGSKDTDI